MRPQHRARRTQRTRLTIVLAAIVLILGVGLGVRTFQTGAGSARPALPPVLATPTVDPRLILHPRTVDITVQLTHGIRLSGTMDPDLPGTNTLHLQLLGTPSRQISHLHLDAVMPGMAMTPSRVTLAAKNGGFQGHLILPMFGTYRVSAAATTNGVSASGILTISIPLPSF